MGRIGSASRTAMARGTSGSRDPARAGGSPLDLLPDAILGVALGLGIRLAVASLPACAASPLCPLLLPLAVLAILAPAPFLHGPRRRRLTFAVAYAAAVLPGLLERLGAMAPFGGIGS